ncbi:putative adenosine monophosphate-protein transferase Fic [Erwinia sp. AnSW2-5]|uniref:putative adenosine monophosphate-protein transferase Fic n=1 Tax=Erwinia sp. AnSW2-5 TaxID=3367692 RepID=UPI00385CACDE
MDKYDASNDHYCYPGSLVLQNKLGIQDADTLIQAERDITRIKIEDIHYFPPPWDLTYFQHLHSILFSDLYPWAGQLRTVDISKGGTRFCRSGRIIPEIQKLFQLLDQEQWLSGLSREEFCQKIAEYYCEFNMIHPFREGNGRVQRLFFEHLTLSAGFTLDWADITVEEWIQANIDGVFVNYAPMQSIFMRIVS